MPNSFPHIGLFAKTNSDAIQETFIKLVDILVARGHTLIFESASAAILAQGASKYTNKIPGTIVDAALVGKNCDLIIVVGGDGSILKTARSTVDYNVPILGINRGSLGFMADIKPDQMQESLTLILNGSYSAEQRSLLELAIYHKGDCISSNLALNDAVLFNGDIARMIEFEVFIDNHFVMSQRSDGMIIATPTGSTAYSLSAGGPIIYPSLGVISLVPMFPHTLTSRPIVISDASTIRLAISPKKSIAPKISCDGQEHINLKSGDEVFLKKHPQQIVLLHPKGYDYFALLREKLGWNTYIGSDRFKR